MQFLVLDKKRGKEEKEILNRVKVFSRLQTSHDHEEFANGLLCESRFSASQSMLGYFAII